MAALVSYQNEEYKKLLPQYKLIRDCLTGEKQIKARRQDYLPMPNETDQSPENVARYRQYLLRAVFYNVTWRTLAGLNGQIFLRDPVVEVPTSMQVIVDDATGSGIPLQQLAQELTDYVLPYGRGGLFVDYPDVPNGASKAQMDAGEVRPVIYAIAPWQIINWRVKVIGAKRVLTLVVFEEEYDKDDNGFETKKGKQWRVLRLDEAGNYVQEIYRDKSGATPFKRVVPLNSKGQPFKEVAFKFAGSANNDPKPDMPPLYDMAALNIAHYRNSADYEEATYIMGQPMLWFAGLTQEWVKDVLNGKVLVGSRAATLLPVGGEAGILQVEPNTMAKEAMDQKEAQMLALGAKLVEGSQVQRTATEADLDNVSETSVLSSVAKNCGAAIVWALEYCAQFMGVEGSEISYDMNTEFDLVNLSPEERKQLLSEWQSGAITFEEMRGSLRRAGIAFLSDEIAKDQLEQEAADNLKLEAESAETLAAAAAAGAPDPVV